MHVTGQAQRLDAIFARLDAALTAFEARAARDESDSASAAVAAADFQWAWQCFLSDWEALFGQPLPCPTALPFTLAPRGAAPISAV